MSSTNDMNFSGYGENVVTMLSSGVEKGKLVKLSANYKVTECSSGDVFLGQAVNVRGDYAAVQTKGHFKLKKSGTINLGYQKLCAAGDDTVKTLDSGIPCFVIFTDATYVEFIL